MSVNMDYPYHFEPRGLTAVTSEDDHIRDMILQVLFTAPGERVNRPDFGSGLLQMVFAPNSDELATATQFLIQGALQRWLGDVILVDAVSVESEESTLRVSVSYTNRRNQQRRVEQFTNSVATGVST